MGSALTEAREEIQEAMTQIGVALPGSQFGLAEVRDYLRDLGAPAGEKSLSRANRRA